MREAIYQGTVIIRGNMVTKLAPSKGWGPKGRVGHEASNIEAFLVMGGGGRYLYFPNLHLKTHPVTE